MSDIGPKIKNVVCTANLNCKLDLKEIAIAKTIKNAEYSSKKFSALRLKIKEPKTTILIFVNGKIVCLGGKSVEESEKACHKVEELLKDLGYPVLLKDFKVQNMVGSCHLNFKIPLTKLNSDIRKNMNQKAVYEAEVYPALIYYFGKNQKNEQKSKKYDKNLNLVCLIYGTGNIVITGAKNQKHLSDVWNEVSPILLKFKG